MENNENNNPNVQVPRTYTLNHPVLPPLASQAFEDVAAAINIGDNIGIEHLLAAKNQRLHREYLRVTDAATAQEVIDAEIREFSIKQEISPPMPMNQGWAQVEMQGMNVRLDQMNQGMNVRFNQMNVRLDQMNQGMNVRLNQMNVRLDQGMQELRDSLNQINDNMVQMNRNLNRINANTAQNTNRTLSRLEAMIQVPNNNGEYPPQELNEDLIRNMAGDEMNALLDFYDIEFAPRETVLSKKLRLCFHLGISPNFLS